MAKVRCTIRINYILDFKKIKKNVGYLNNFYIEYICVELIVF